MPPLSKPLSISDQNFSKISRFAMQRWGLHITAKKRQLVCGRFSKFLSRNPRFANATKYLKHMESDGNDEEWMEFFDLLSTNVTHFFREYAHFEYLERHLYPEVNRQIKLGQQPRIRLWSSACSNGAEPYSMAIHAMEQISNIDCCDFKILATDLSTSMLQEAQQAVYEQKMINAVSEDRLKKFFLKGNGESSEKVKVRPEVCGLVSFGRINLMEKWPFQGPFDVIFCRNVMIYFDADTRCNLVNRMHKLLHPGGLLVIGSAETLSGLDTPYATVRPAVYQRIEGLQGSKAA